MNDKTKGELIEKLKKDFYVTIADSSDIYKYLVSESYDDKCGIYGILVDIILNVAEAKNG